MLHSILSVHPKPASERGALDGHEFVCSCGERAGTSLSESEARRMAAKHLDWHVRSGR